MMTTDCPRCGETVRLPAGEPPADAEAQCPWCGESFPLHEILERLPPLLKLTPLAGAVPLPAEPLALESWDQDPFVVHDSGLGGGAASRARARQRSGGGLRTALGIVGGGLLAIPIALGILWAFGWGPFADSGSRSGGVVANKPADLVEQRWPSNSVASPTEWSEPAGLTTLPTPATGDPHDGAQPATDPGSGEESAAESAGSPLSPSAEAAAAALPSPQTEPSGRMALSTASGSASGSAGDQAEGPKLAATAELAVKMIDTLPQINVDEATRKRYLTKTYQTIALACDMATGASPSIQRLAGAIKESPLLEDLGSAGADWIDFPDRGNDGVLLIGSSDGSSLKLEGGPFLNLRGESQVPAAARVLVLGRITDPETVTAIWVEPL